MQEQADNQENQEDQLLTYQYHYQECEERIDDFDTAISLANEDFEASEQTYLRQHTHIEAETQLLQAILDAYEGKDVNFDTTSSEPDVYSESSEEVGTFSEHDIDGDSSTFEEYSLDTSNPDEVGHEVSSSEE